MSAVAWLLEHPTLTLTVCAVLVVQALLVRTQEVRHG
jgi:hypothetical protein